MSQNTVAERNQYPLRKDYRLTFYKDPSEREQLATLKTLNIIARRKAYGADYKKYLNVPEKSLSQPIINRF